MTVFDDRFANHAVFATLKTLRTQLEAAEEHLSTTDLQEAHARLGQVADYVERILNAAEPALTSKALLDALNTSLQNAANEVQAFMNTNQPARLIGNANNNADAALQQVASLNVPLVPSDVEGLRDDVTNFRRSAGQHLRNLEGDIAKAKASLEEQVQQTQQSIRQTGHQIQAKLTEVENAKQAVETSRQHFQSQFSEAQDRRSTEYSRAVDERTKQLQEFINDAQDKLDAELKALTEKAGEYLKELEDRRAEVQKVVGAIGADALSGGFNKTALAEARAANLWRWIGVALFLLAIAAAALLFGPLHQATELTRIGAKAVIVVPLIGLGTYAFKESGRHRRVQWRNRRLALELASIDPYLALFEDGDRNTVKKELIERWFAQPESPLKDDSYSPSALVRLAETALGLLGKKL